MTREEFEAQPDDGNGVLVRWTDAVIRILGSKRGDRTFAPEARGYLLTINGTVAVIEWKQPGGGFKTEECHAGNIEVARGPRPRRRKAKA